MMLDEARVVRARLARADAASSSVEEAEALAKKKKELFALAAKVESLANRRAMLRQGGIPLSFATDLDKVKQLCGMILTRFTELPKASTLVDKQRWTKLSEVLLEFNASEETLQKQDWKEYFGTRLFAGVSPEQRKQTILITLPENQKEWDRYKRLYTQFAQYRNSVPVTAEELGVVQACSKELSKIRFVENDDVPVAVREFFNATSSGSGASLDLLTTEVIAWLRDNNMLNNYAVRAR
jgi:hypothetical protein